MQIKLPELDKVYNDDCLPFLKNNIPDSSISLIQLDPPYGYSYLGKNWDCFNEIVEPKGAYQKQKGFKKLPRNKPTYMYSNFLPIWKECLRVLKPGGFMFAMSAPRQDTLLEQIRAIKDAGFRIDFSSIYWTYSSGFPKASNVSKIIDKRLGVEPEIISERTVTDIRGNSYGNSKQKKMTFKKTRATSEQAKVFDGAYGGLQLKPALEVIIVAMKPLSEKSYVDQALSNGKGITWLDDLRIPHADCEKVATKWSGYSGGYGITRVDKDFKSGADTRGRFPANLLVSNNVLGDKHSRYFDLDKWAVEKEIKETFPFLIVPKASKREKNSGCEKLTAKPLTDRGHQSSLLEKLGYKTKNNHPTVKPIKLMAALITLASREGDIVLDCFAGSGSTLLAAKQLNRRFIGIEREKEYCDIANARLAACQEPLKKAA